MTRTAPPRRFLIPLLLAIVLACELGVAAADGRNGSAARNNARWTASIGELAASTAASIAKTTTSVTANVPSPAETGRRAAIAPALAMHRAKAGAARYPWNPGTVARPEIVATPRASVVAPPRSSQGTTSSRGVTTGSRASTASVKAHAGRNHVWIPSLGISRSVSFFPCTRKEPPANYVYRWGCAGRNNVYLMGHAYGVFKALHDAYVRGRLRKDLTVDYADGSGVVRRYAVIWWKVTPPTTAASWAWAAQSTPSMTLQTCVGPTGQDRLMVRLVATH
jgi:hypothetical protein